MDKYLRKLFKDGNNDGNIIIISEDNIRIRCHDFVLKSQCEFFLAGIHYQGIEKGNEITFILAFPAKVIRALISKMYTTKYYFTDLNPSEIISVILLADQLIVRYKDKIITELVKSFKSHLEEDNWLELLVSVHGYQPLEQLEICIVDYFVCNILTKNTNKIKWDDYPSIIFGEVIDELQITVFPNEEIQVFLQKIFNCFKGQRIKPWPVRQQQNYLNIHKLKISKTDIMDRGRLDKIKQLLDIES
jgi:hypothetical protein